ncbi:hypothetical protein LAZ67_12000351 [Cordylochernes scorpioides]|uniref:DDE-1 domain-containing protein n=1 Tax=Cordylochernes scorpioides TaxID=51811 RepID=A0ABY6L0H4_9ARAC|nr:hypothetical protein LAZ67_12000351 [Cordylochernes scorpioides]
MLVRTVELRTGKGLLRRPVNKVAVLPVQSDLTLTTGPAGSMERKGYTLGLEKMGQDNFEASNGWLEKFKVRRNIAFKRLHGEAGSVDANSVATWKGGIIPSLLAKYSPQDIFNADETGLFYKLLPNQTMTIRGEKCEGGKKSKERITVLVCCNMDGSEKLPLLYIGKYRRPRCFHGMNIPSNYHFNKKAWMTGAIFTDWLKKLDQIFKRRERKILLILDNCPAHQIPEGLQNIEIRFLPALTTSALQPCDMGIIKALKDQYRKRMITYLLTCMEEKKNAQVHLLFAISWLDAAWVGVSSSTIKNCFSHSGFVMDEAMEEVVEEEMNRCFEALKKHQAIDVNYIDFLEVDKDVQVAGEQSIEEIVKEVMGKEEDEEGMHAWQSTTIGTKPFVLLKFIFICLELLENGFRTTNAKAKTSLEDDDVPIDDTTTQPLFTPQEKGRKGTRDKFPRLRWNPWQKHVRSMSVTTIIASCGSQLP